MTLNTYKSYVINPVSANYKVRLVADVKSMRKKLTAQRDRRIRGYRRKY